MTLCVCVDTSHESLLSPLVKCCFLFSLPAAAIGCVGAGTAASSSSHPPSIDRAPTTKHEPGRGKKKSGEKEEDDGRRRRGAKSHFQRARRRRRKNERRAISPQNVIPVSLSLYYVVPCSSSGSLLNFIFPSPKRFLPF